VCEARRASSLPSVRIDRDRLRIYALAIASGVVAQVGLVLAIYGSSTKALGILFFLEAVILGLVFGARPGMAAAVLPWFGFYPASLIVDDYDQPIALLSAVVFVMILMAFFSGMAGAMRDRYGSRSVPPPGA
jgi:hypothetical protein